MAFVSLPQARLIAENFFGCAALVYSLDHSYIVKHGGLRLQVMKEIVVPGQAYCRVQVLEKPVGYFTCDLKDGRMSPLWKED